MTNQVTMPRLAWAAVLLVTLALAASVRAQLPDSELPIQLDADGTDVDRLAGTVTFTGIRVSQGALSIRAATAESTGLDFEDSTWTFTGDVQVKSSDTVISASAITLRFAARQLANASISGSPMSFEQKRDGTLRVQAQRADFVFAGRTMKSVDLTGQPVIYDFVAAFDEDSVSGRAQQMQYDARAGLVTLLNDAWIGQGANQISGNKITYNFAEQRVEAASDAGGQQRVHITISPPARETRPSQDAADNPKQ